MLLEFWLTESALHSVLPGFELGVNGLTVCSVHSALLVRRSPFCVYFLFGKLANVREVGRIV